MGSLRRRAVRYLGLNEGWLSLKGSALMLVKVCMSVVALVGLPGCTSRPAGPETRADVYPGATLTAHDQDSSSELFEANGSTCSTQRRDYVTDDPTEDVASFFANRGFEKNDEARGEAGNLIRWTGERTGSEETWRKVDVSSGSLAGSDRTTAYSIFRAACSPPAGSGQSPAATPAG